MTIFNCHKCNLWRSRTQVVVGRGSVNPKILFIGEAPGATEDKQGIPFCGKSGQVLEELIEKANIKPIDYHITNLVKCRPPKNRNPKPDEIKACSPYLEKEIRIFSPKIIVPLGRFSSEYIYKKYDIPFSTISKEQGKIQSLNRGSNPKYVMASFHPAAALYTPANKKKILLGFRKINKIIKEK